MPRTIPRPVANKRKIIGDIFQIPDNGAKWKDLLERFSSKSAMHRWFQKCTRNGVFEMLTRKAGKLVEDCGEYKLYECYLDATFS